MTEAAESRDQSARVAALFTRSSGEFRFARWGRAPAIAVYGTDQKGRQLFEGALTALCGLMNLSPAEEDPELGANFLVFLTARWDELLEVPNLDKLIPDLTKLVSVLKGSGANQYRIFGFDDAGAIKICITLLQFDDDLRKASPQAVAIGQTFQGMLLWSDHAFTGETPLAMVAETKRAVIKPWYVTLMRAAYAPTLPLASRDATTAGLIAARMVEVEAMGSGG
ncbi:MAG: hypothetical protein AAF713_06985 [Pseudomonadota bacterium]